MKCILHIGTEKTATTSLQRFFDRNREAVLRKGLWYPKCLGHEWHRKLAMYAMPTFPPDDAFLEFGITDERTHAEFNADLAQKFFAEYSGVSADYCLISSEHFHSRLTSVADVQRVKGFLSPYFEEFIVIASFRPQVDLLVSLMSTIARGNTVVDESFIRAQSMDSLYYNYDLLISMWEKVFEKDSIRVVPFKRIADLRSIISFETGLDFAQFGHLPKENSALDVEVIAMLNNLKRQRVDVQGFGGVFDELPVRERLVLSKELAHSITKKCVEGNRNLTGRYATIHLDDLEPDFSKFSDVGNVHLLEGRCDFSNSFSDFFIRSKIIFQNNRILREHIFNSGSP